MDEARNFKIGLAGKHWLAQHGGKNFGITCWTIKQEQFLHSLTLEMSRQTSWLRRTADNDETLHQTIFISPSLSGSTTVHQLINWFLVLLLIVEVSQPKVDVVSILEHQQAQDELGLTQEKQDSWLTMKSVKWISTTTFVQIVVLSMHLTEALVING